MKIGNLIASPLLKTAIELLLPVVHDVLGGGDFADRTISKIQLKTLDIDGKEIAAAQANLKSELEGNALQRNWRPFTMIVFVLVFIFIVVYVPVHNAYSAAKILIDPDLASQILTIIGIGIGGYIGSRGLEKITATAMDNRVRKTTVIQQQNDGMPPPPVPEDADIITAPFMRPER